MTSLVKKNTKALTADRLAPLQFFIDDIKSGKILLFQEKTARARKNLKKAGLIN